MTPLKTYNVCFIGRTGNGKTTLINKLFNTAFQTHSLVSCTKELFSMTRILPNNDKYEAITVYDTPGIGEFSSNSVYWRYYEEAINKADCIILVSTFDRTDAPVQRFLRSLKACLNPEKENIKFIVVLNHIDSAIITNSNNTYQPWDNVNNIPTDECKNNIETRIGIIHERYDNRLLPFEVIPTCAARDYNIETLKQEIYNF